MADPHPTRWRRSDAEGGHRALLVRIDGFSCGSDSLTLSFVDENRRGPVLVRI